MFCEGKSYLYKNKLISKDVVFVEKNLFVYVIGMKLLYGTTIFMANC